MPVVAGQDRVRGRRYVLALLWGRESPENGRRWRMGGAGEWRLKRTESGSNSSLHSPTPTPLLTSPTLSAGESMVSGGKSKVS